MSYIFSFVVIKMIRNIDLNQRRVRLYLRQCWYLMKSQKGEEPLYLSIFMYVLFWFAIVLYNSCFFWGINVVQVDWLDNPELAASS